MRMKCNTKISLWNRAFKLKMEAADFKGELLVIWLPGKRSRNGPQQTLGALTYNDPNNA